jgi:hypothetical protein
MPPARCPMQSGIPWRIARYGRQFETCGRMDRDEVG